MEPTAQGTQPVATPDNAQAEVGAGVQKRIDELTAQRYDAERKAAAMEAREQAYLAQIAELARTQAPAVQAAPVEIDPGLKAQFDALYGAQQKRIEMTLAQLQRAQSLTQVRTQAPAYLPDPVKLEAEKLTEEYARQGFNLDAKMAYDIASGRFYQQQLVEQASARAAGRAFNGTGVPMLTGQSIPNVTQAPPKPDLDKMSLQERLKYWDSAPAIGM